VLATIKLKWKSTNKVGLKCLNTIMEEEAWDIRSTEIPAIMLEGQTGRARSKRLEEKRVITARGGEERKTEKSESNWNKK